MADDASFSVPDDAPRNGLSEARQPDLQPRDMWSDEFPDGALPKGALLVASAPLAAEPYGAAVLPVSQYDFDQVLFGFEAQLRAFGHVMRRHGRSLGLAPLPEIFATARSLAAIAHAGQTQGSHIQGGHIPGDAPVIVHLRFGPARHARVLKGARNVMVLADDPCHLPIVGSAHPFGSDIRLPAPFSTVFAYARRRAGSVIVDGRARHERVLGEAFVHADLDREAFGEPEGDDAGGGAFERGPAWYTVAGLDVRSFAEIAREPAWLRPHPNSSAAAAADWRRALAIVPDVSGAIGPGERGPRRPMFIMLPWNLANSASIVPDIVCKLGRRDPFDSADYRIVLFPFNATPNSARLIEALAGALRQIAGQRSGALRSLFLARLHTLRDAARLRAVFHLAWLEADDPESDWTGRRLARLGIEVGLLGSAACKLPHRFAIAPDGPIRLNVSDNFGDRAYANHALSTRQLAALLVRSRAEIAGLCRL